MTLKRYWLGDGALAVPRADGHLCYFGDVEAYVAAQRANARRDAYLTAADVCEQLRLSWVETHGRDTAFDAGRISAFYQATEELRKLAHE